MSKIKKLPLHEAQKIAAGEVVERPANVVKELVENSLDAGASSIFLYLTDAGKSLIRIVDNGCGMDAHDARLCFEQYATSKIEHVDDLPTVVTFGFRGEALASIAAVSKVTIVTKEASAEYGIQLSVENGAIKNEHIAACNTGTDISIADLFYNVPARRKFLKTTETEWRAITQLLQAISFNRPDVHFKLFHNDKLIYNCSPAKDLSVRIQQVWDTAISAIMTPIVAEQNSSIAVTGMISNTHHARYDRTNIFFLVNNRWVKNQKLSNALLKGYANSLPQGRFPSAVISLSVPLHEVDVNIHPRKEEVAFLHPRIIENYITTAVKKSLEAHVSTTLARATTTWFSEPAQPLTWPLMRTTKSERFEPVQPVIFEAIKAKNDTLRDVSFPKYEQPVIETEKEEKNSIIQTLDAPAPEYTILNQYHNTYIVLETPQSLILVDQHAAHERILYEEFSKRFDDAATVTLLFPCTVHVNMHDIALIEPHLPFLQKFGIHAEIFGSDQIIVTASPVHAQNIDFVELILGVISWLKESLTLDKPALTKILQEKVHAQMACKAAVKAGDALTTEHMQRLIRDLYACQNRFSCPHGRPVLWELPLYDIEKKFRRKV